MESAEQNNARVDSYLRNEDPLAIQRETVGRLVALIQGVFDYGVGALVPGTHRLRVPAGHIRIIGSGRCPQHG